MAGGARSPWFEPRASLTADWLHSWLVSALDLLAGLTHLALAAGYLTCGGTNGILAVHRRSIAEPAAPRQAHEEENGTQNDRRRSTQDDGTTARRWQAMAAGRLSSDSSVVAPAATDHCDRLRSIANQASSCLYCPEPGDENVGPVALATTDLLTVATEHAGHPGVATIPTMETEDEVFPALADGDLPTAGNRCCYPVGTGCPANDSLQATRSSDCLLRHPPRPLSLIHISEPRD